MIESLRCARYLVSDLDVALDWYSQVFEIEPYSEDDSVVTYHLGGTWLELMKSSAPNANSTTISIGVDNLDGVLLRLAGVGISQSTEFAMNSNSQSISFTDPFNKIINLIEIFDTALLRASSQRAAEKLR